MTEQEPFKQCPLCGAVWADYRDFVADRSLRVEGYQASLVAPELGMILVTHAVTACRTTLSVWAVALRVLYDGPEGTERWTGLDDGLRLRIDQGRLAECTAEYDMAWVDHALHWLRRHELPPHLETNTQGRANGQPDPHGDGEAAAAA